MFYLYPSSQSAAPSIGVSIIETFNGWVVLVSLVLDLIRVPSRNRVSPSESVGMYAVFAERGGTMGRGSRRKNRISEIDFAQTLTCWRILDYAFSAMIWNYFRERFCSNC